MISKSVLKQYIDFQEEIKEVNERIIKVEKRISEIEKEISKLKQDKYTFRKREGDWFTYDVLIPEVDVMIENLVLLKSSYSDRICTLSSLLDRISGQIFDLRIRQGFSWKMVSAKMGSMNSEENLRSMFNRYLRKNGVR